MLNVRSTIYSSQFHISVLSMPVGWKSKWGGESPVESFFIDKKIPEPLPKNIQYAERNYAYFQAMLFYKTRCLLLRK